MTERQDDDPVTLYVSVKDREEGIRIGNVLIDGKLAACANIMDGVTSIFLWEGKTQQESEAVLFAKTRAGLIDAATKAIIASHSYDCPCIVALPIVGGNPDFINWIGTETRP